MNDCILWTGEKQKDGYGLVRRRVDSRKVGEVAHRKAWREKYGPIPTGLLVLHKCDNPPCINLDHLFLGTQADNMKDRVGKGRIRPRPVSCKRGHLFEEGSFYIYQGRRHCKQCMAVRQRKWRTK